MASFSTRIIKNNTTQVPLPGKRQEIDEKFMSRWHERTIREAQEYRRNAFDISQEEFDAIYDDEYFEMLDLID
jgi:hypothetical protein